MGLFKDGISLLPYAASMAGAIVLASYGAYHIGEDLGIEDKWDERNNYTREELPELYENYEEYVKKIGESLRECNTDRLILKDFAFYLTMLEHGYISYGDQYLQGTLPIELGDALGATVATGNGVCRHAAGNLADVLCSLGYDAKYVVGKVYSTNEQKPDEVNHAVVYVEEDGISYLLDPMNSTVYLKKVGTLYYDMRSQEDNYYCFEPDMSFNVLNDSEMNNMELMFNVGNDFKKHWDILKEFNEYYDNANLYLDYFSLYEVQELLENENNIRVIFEDIIMDGINSTKKMKRR